MSINAPAIALSIEVDKALKVLTENHQFGKTTATRFLFNLAKGQPAAQNELIIILKPFLATLIARPMTLRKEALNIISQKLFKQQHCGLLFELLEDKNNIIQDCAAKALAFLALKSSSLKVTLISNNCFKVLVYLLESETNAEYKYQIISRLAALSNKSKPNRHLIIEHNIEQLLLTLLTTETANKLIKPSAELLAVLSKEAKMRKQLIFKDQIMLLVINLLNSELEDDVQNSIVKLIAFLSDDNDAKLIEKIVLNTGITQLLFPVLEYSSSNQARSYAFEAFINFTSCNSLAKLDVARAGIPALLMCFFKPETPTSVKEKALLILLQLSYGSQAAADVIINSGAIKPLIGLLDQSSSDIIKQRAIGVLYHLAFEPLPHPTLESNRIKCKMVQHGVIRALISLQSHNNTDEVLQRTRLLLIELAASSTKRAFLIINESERQNEALLPQAHNKNCFFHDFWQHSHDKTSQAKLTSSSQSN